MADQNQANRMRRNQSIEKLSAVASEDKIKAVSTVLTAKKAVFDRQPVPVSLPDVPGSPGEIARRLTTLPTSRDPFESSPASIKTPPIRLPEAGVGDGQKDNQPSSLERSKIDASGDVPPLPALRSERTSAPDARDRPVNPSTTSTSIESVGGIAQARNVPSAMVSTNPMTGGSGHSIPKMDGWNSGPQPDVSVTHPLADGGPTRLPRSDDTRPKPRSEQVDDVQPRSALIRVNRLDSPVNQASFSDGSRVKAASVDQLGEPQPSTSPNEPQGSVDARGIRASGSGMSVPVPANSVGPAEPSMSLVRNPLSNELRNFSMASPPQPETDGSSPGSRLMMPRPDDPAFGGSGSSSAGGSMDLSKTNELLQQLVDAVRKQRGSPLPSGGPSVYPDR